MKCTGLASTLSISSSAWAALVLLLGLGAAGGEALSGGTGRHRTEYLKLCGINPLDRAYDDIINLGLELGLGAGLGGWARSGQG